MQYCAVLFAAASAAAAARSPATCEVKNCVLKSKFASAGPGYKELHSQKTALLAVGKDGKDSTEGCPFADDNEPEPSKKEYLQYMRGLGKVADMPREERVAYAKKMEAKWLAESKEPVAKEPSVDVTKPGIEAVNSKTWRELRRANKFDFLIVFYAPWCTHCKAFVTAENAPLKALNAKMEQLGGPKVVTFDAIASSPPITIESVPAIYLFKKTGEAVPFEEDQHNAEALMAFALDKPKPAAALVEVKPHSAERAAPAWSCALSNCALKSPLARKGPLFADGVRFFAVGSNGKDTRKQCPFGGGDDEPEPSKKEYMKYMKGLDKVGDMSPAERRAYALQHEKEWLENPPDRRRKVKEPTVDVAKPGVESVNSTTWHELRDANKFDFLIAFYAPWCPHCKRFITAENAPIKALSESLEKVNGPKVVTFDMIADDAPLTIDAVPAVYLFRTDGQAIPFDGDAHDVESLMAFALDKATPKKAQQSLVAKHLRKTAA